MRRFQRAIARSQHEVGPSVRWGLPPALGSQWHFPLAGPPDSIARVKRLLILLLPALAVIGLACGGGGGATPTAGRPATTAGPASPGTGPTSEQAVEFQAEDGIVLKGHLFGTGVTAVLLAHMRPADQTAWFDFARVLAGQNIAALTFDFRGYGETGGPKDYAHIDRDMKAAIRFLKARGYHTVYLVGASMGGTASLAVAKAEGAAGVVTLSAPDQFEGLDVRGAVGELTVPKLFLASQGDDAAVSSLATLYEGAAEPKDRQIFDGSAHGTDMLQGDRGQQVADRILAFLKQGS